MCCVGARLPISCVQCSSWFNRLRFSASTHTPRATLLLCNLFPCLFHHPHPVQANHSLVSAGEHSLPDGSAQDVVGHHLSEGAVAPRHLLPLSGVDAEQSGDLVQRTPLRDHRQGELMVLLAATWLVGSRVRIPVFFSIIPTYTHPPLHSHFLRSPSTISSTTHPFSFYY
jgi:hypothetical protein